MSDITTNALAFQRAQAHTQEVTDVSPIPQTREQWLVDVASQLRTLFAQKGYTVPERVRITCGWPSIGGTRAKKMRIGEAWSSACSGDATFEIFISPALADAAIVSATLVHELVHCVVGLECGHKGAFIRCAKAMGLEGKMTATVAGEALRDVLKGMCDAAGTYPHAVLGGLSNAEKKQSTRMLKVECPGCGYVVRTTAKWLEMGTPTCVCGEEMAAA